MAVNRAGAPVAYLEAQNRACALAGKAPSAEDTLRHSSEFAGDIIGVEFCNSLRGFSTGHGSGAAAQAS